jgi:hypothetical protein
MNRTLLVKNRPQDIFNRPLLVKDCSSLFFDRKRAVGIGSRTIPDRRLYFPDPSRAAMNPERTVDAPERAAGDSGSHFRESHLFVRNCPRAANDSQLLFVDPSRAARPISRAAGDSAMPASE